MLDYMIYIITFTVGSILGLLYSYSKHGEPFVAVTDLNIPFMVVSIFGWFWDSIQAMLSYLQLVFSSQGL